ncbi:MAG: helix-turn-helix domain-containing protein [Peptococcaceae bacterium]|nr:helix-turn-helix domain-containing protein [Peptococcaceae bacterium]
MQGIGEILKKAREEKGISLEDVAEATKIRSKYLKALEDEQFDALPGDVYSKGFATAYLKYLGIKDRPDVLEIMKPKVKEPEPAVEAEPEKPRKLAATPKRKQPSDPFEETPLNKNAKLIIILSLAAILLLLVVQGVYSRQMAAENQPEEQISQQVEEQQQETVDVPEEPEVTPEPEAPVYDGLEMRLEILNVNANVTEQCWMQITVDGKQTETTMSEGQIQDIKAAQSIQLNLGNAGVVKVTVNGQELGTLGSQGKVVKKTFLLEDYVTEAQ